MHVPPAATPEVPRATGPRSWLAVIGLVYLLLVGVGIVGDGFEWISGGAEGAERVFAFAENPIVGVILGILATALVQSSSTVSAVIVGLVAGGVPVATAVPMIMGANMGTSITNTIVSLGSLGTRGGFGRSFQAATVHDFFNLFCILLLLPIEILFQPLERMTGRLAELLAGGANASMKDLNLIGALTKPAAEAPIRALGALPDTAGASIAIALGIVCIVASVVLLGRQLRAVMQGRAKSLIDRSIGRGPIAGVLSGTIVTVLVQSSSTTTSLVVPLAGAGTLTLRQVYPFTLGANVGTCITALLAATAITGAAEVPAMQIALVHFLYNVVGVLIFLLVPGLKEWPMRSAQWLGSMSERNRGWAFAYVFGVFFALPGLVLAGQQTLRESEGIDVDDAVLEAVEDDVESTEFSID